jgi:hypothetical protein
MKRVLSVIVVLLIFASLSYAWDKKFSFGIWEFKGDEAEFTLDISGDVGYAIPLNLNDKAADKDISENFDPVTPAFSASAGLGITSTSESSLPAHLTIAFEYGRSQFENDSVNLAINSFGVSTRLIVHPWKHFSFVQGRCGGLYFLHSDPEIQQTMTWADFTADSDARTDKLHYFDSNELLIGVSIGAKSRVEICAGASLETYYPRFLFWREFSRRAVNSAILGIFSTTAEMTDVWALTAIGSVAVGTMEVFNLNFYPESVGETHQHLLTPEVSIIVHF